MNTTNLKSTLAVADEALAAAQAKEAGAQQKLSEAEAALPQAPDIEKAVGRVRELRARCEDTKAVTAVLKTRRDAAARELAEAELEALVAEQAVAEAAVEPAAEQLAALVREVAGRIIKAWGEFDAIRRKADQLASQLQSEGKQPPRRATRGLAAGVLASERYMSTPHTSINLDPMSSAAALVAYEKSAPAREAEDAEQRRRVVALEEERQLKEGLVSPDPVVRAAAEKKARERLTNWRGKGAGSADVGSGMSESDRKLLEKARLAKSIREPSEE